MSEHWPPEWGDPDAENLDASELAASGPDAEQPDTEQPDTEDLAEVASALASVPLPALPAAVEARIGAAIAAEAATRTERTGAIGVSATARSLSCDGPFPAAAVGRTATAPRRRSRRRLLSAPAIGSLLACLLVGGFAYLFTRGTSPSELGVSSAAGSAAAAPYHSANGPARPFARSPSNAIGSGEKVPSSQNAGFAVTESGTRYQPGALARQVRARLAGTGPSTPAASEPVPEIAPSAALAGCVDRLTGNVAPSLVDRATYAGRPAYVIAVPGRAWVVGLGCTAASTEQITAVALARLSGNLRALGSVERRAIGEKGACSDRRT